MTRFSQWADKHTDPTGREHPLSDADEAMHPLIGAALLVIVACVVIGIIGWLGLPAGDRELAPMPGTTTTVQP